MSGEELLNGASSGAPLAQRLELVEAGLREAAASAGRTRNELTLIVVTKFHPAQLVRDLAALGVTDVGENRHQEAQQKSAEIADPNLRWHFIGQLQTKKARQAAQYAHAIHSIDRVRLVDALEGIERDIEAFVQINLTDDPARGGASPDELLPLVERVLQNEHLRLRGVMAVAPLPHEEPAGKAFERLRTYSELVQTLAPHASDISAGMTHDYREAIAAGATHLRIGSAITGNRPIAG